MRTRACKYSHEFVPLLEITITDKFKSASILMSSKHSHPHKLILTTNSPSLLTGNPLVMLTNSPSLLTVNPLVMLTNSRSLLTGNPL